MRFPSPVHRPAALLALSHVIAALSIAALTAAAGAQVVAYDQPHNGTGTVYKSAWYPPDGLDGDAYVYDDFIVATSTAITEIRWRGGYTNYLSGAGKSPVFDFRVSLYASTPGLAQPDIVSPPLRQYVLGGNAGETLAGTFGGVQMYDYAFVLPSAFMAVAGERYWVQIEAYQGVTPLYYWPPDWGFAASSSGTGHYFRAITGGTAGGGTLYQTITGDAAFTLYAAGTATFNIAASENPAFSGTVSGSGPYPAGATATLVATPALGWGFLDWTEGATVVSNNPSYAFTVAADRTLVANFVPSWIITASAFPDYGGTVAGAGPHNDGTSVSVVATANPGFRFVDWTEYGSLVSGAPIYSFPATMDRVLVANFAPIGLGAMFDFDTGQPPLSSGQGIPLAQTSAGVTATFTSPQGGAFSVQSDAGTFWHLPLFSGHYLMPNNINRNTLQVAFDRPLDGIWMHFATTDNNQVELATNLQLTAWLGSPSGTPVGTAVTKGAYIGGTFPMGTLAYLAPAPFDLVQLVLPYQPNGTTGLLVDDITVRVASTVSVPPGGTRGLALSAGPNPSRGETSLAYTLPQAADVRLAVYDLLGRRVRALVAGSETAGPHAARWDGRDESGARAAAGAYVVRLDTGGASVARRIVLLR